MTEGMVWNTTYIADVFNLTLSSNSKSSYALTSDNGGLFLDKEMITFNANMSSCSSLESNEYRMIPTPLTPSGVPGGRWAYPSVNLKFDSRTANITVDGYFLGTSYLWANTTGGRSPLGPTTVNGRISLSFNGVIDTYHSDLLLNESAIPKWIRTVGFGNNSLNIGYRSLAPPKELCVTGAWILPAALFMYLSLLY